MGALRQQPRGYSRIDRTNPITRGLAFFQTGAFDGPFANVNNALVMPFGVGQGRCYVAASNQYLLATDDKVKSGPLTLFALARPNSLLNNKALISIGASTNDRTGLYTANGRIAMFSGAPSANGQAISGSNLASGTTYALAGRVMAPNSRDVWVDGVQVGTNSNSVSPAAANRIAIGAFWANGGPASGQNYDGVIHLVLVWNRALSDDEMRSLAANPWQVFEGLGELEDQDFGAVESASLSVSPASLLVGGGSIGLQVSRKVGVQSAALVAVGGQVHLRATRRLTMSVADLTVQAGSAQLRALRRLAVAPAVATLVGGAVAFMYMPAESGASYSIPVSPATLALTSGAITMRLSRTITAERVGLTLAAGNVMMRADRKLGLGPAALQMASSQILLRATRQLMVEGAHLELVGGAVSLRYSAQVEYASAPLGAGYSPRRVVVQSRPAQVGGSRLASIQRNRR